MVKKNIYNLKLEKKKKSLAIVIGAEGRGQRAEGRGQRAEGRIKRIIIKLV
ncbi:hypothetical protein [Candidatus Karelsulcia muelleri]|uniref:hypothetical protein n=1 Tax=Candidatus Karelsulcia muelleri TaxID=336810 RepID=UPI0013A5F452|nr:hypothetical protein [Candidatus Karelsulcia muelleri]